MGIEWRRLAGGDGTTCLAGLLSACERRKVVKKRLASLVTEGSGTARGREWQDNSGTFEANGDGSPIACWNKHFSAVRKRVSCCGVMTCR